MSKRAIFAGVVSLVIVLAAAWYFLSPGYAMSQLKDAAESGDRDALEARIDFPSVREGLKADLRAHLAAEMVKEEGNGFAAFGGMLAMGMVDGMIDGFITAESMSAMIKQGRMQDAGATPSSGDQEVEWTIERDGLSQFSARPKVPDGERAPSLVFERDGLEWKLTEIDIPPMPE